MRNHRRVNHLPGTGSAGTLDPLRCVTACNPSCCANCINLQMGRPGLNCEAQSLPGSWLKSGEASRWSQDIPVWMEENLTIMLYWDNLRYTIYNGYHDSCYCINDTNKVIVIVIVVVVIIIIRNTVTNSVDVAKNETPESACREEADGDNKPHSQSFAHLKLWMKVSPGVLGYWKIPWYPLVDIHFYIFFVKIGDYWGFHLDMFVSCRVSFIWLVASNWKSRPATAPGAMPLQPLLQCCRRRARRGCGPAELTAWPDLIGGYRQLLRPNSTIRTLFSKHKCDPM